MRGNHVHDHNMSIRYNGSIFLWANTARSLNQPKMALNSTDLIQKHAQGKQNYNWLCDKKLVKRLEGIVRRLKLGRLRKYGAEQKKTGLVSGRKLLALLDVLLQVRHRVLQQFNFEFIQFAGTKHLLNTVGLNKEKDISDCLSWRMWWKKNIRTFLSVNIRRLPWGSKEWFALESTVVLT